MSSLSLSVLVALRPSLLLHLEEPATTPFRPEWSLHPSVLIGVAALALLYGWGLRDGRRRLGAGARVAPWQPFCFGAGLLVMLGSLNGPIHDLSDSYLFSVHMAQHLLLTMLLPPLLIAGIPGWMLDPVLRHPLIQRMARLITRPVVAGVFFSVILLVWHTLRAYDLAMRHHGLHVTMHLMFMVGAVILWWPVMSPAPALPRLGPGPAMLYLFLVQLPMQLMGAIITFADTPLYTWYTLAPRTWGLSPLDDQKVGGLLMWVVGNLWIWGAMSVLFFRWARESQREG